MFIGFHQAKVRSALFIHRHHGNRDIGIGVAVMLHKLAVVHAVEVIAGQDQIFCDLVVLEQPQILPHSIGMTDVKFMGPDGINEQALIDAAGKDAEGVYATFGGIPPKEMTGKGKEWYDAYKAKFNSEPEPYAAYGYESAQVVLQAIGKVCKSDREAVRQAVLETKDFPGLLGEWSFDENGDTTSTKMSGSVVKDGKWAFSETLDAK